MARKLNTYVHIDGTAYGPEDDVPDEVAEKITAPGVWEDQAEESEQAPGGDPKGAIERPSARASKATWIDYWVYQGMDREDAEKLNRDDLAALDEVPPAVTSTPTDVPPAVTPTSTELPAPVQQA